MSGEGGGGVEAAGEVWGDGGGGDGGGEGGGGGGGEDGGGESFVLGGGVVNKVFVSGPVVGLDVPSAFSSCWAIAERPLLPGLTLRGGDRNPTTCDLEKNMRPEIFSSRLTKRCEK